MILQTQLKPASNKHVTGQLLKLHDAEMKLINSGPLGLKRLADARATDMMERCPEITKEDAEKIGAGYVMLRMWGLTGQLTQATVAEQERIQRDE